MRKESGGKRRETKVRQTAKKEEPPKEDWVDQYLKDMAEMEPPEDWVAASIYHVRSVYHKKVDQIKVLGWRPVHVDRSFRVVDEADTLCSAVINGEPLKILVHMGKDTKFEFFPDSYEGPWE